MLEHGGNLTRASKEYGIPEEHWLDLSTGINPMGYPVPPAPPSVWQRLPGDVEPLLRAAREYYLAADLLLVAGTQAAIQALPRLRAHSRVTLAALTYNEYAHAWKREGHAVQAVAPREFDARIAETDVLIVCNPNNPTGERVEPERLLEWHARLAAHDGWLIVDEAYIDSMSDASVAPFAHRPGLIVLRSLGKFFGLAGARVGFVVASGALLHALEDELGPWSVAGPAQFVAIAALRDRDWQAQTRAALVTSGRRLHALLARAGIAAQGTSLFQWCQHEQAVELHRALARHAILTRWIQDGECGGIRIGLPGEEMDWRRLERVLDLWKELQCV